MKKGTLTLFLLLAISIPLSAQYVVQGVVTDSLTKEPLPYASVRLKRHDRRNYYRKRRTLLLQNPPLRSSACNLCNRI